MCIYFLLEKTTNISVAESKFISMLNCLRNSKIIKEDNLQNSEQLLQSNMVKLRLEINEILEEPYCTGILISLLHVLTAAHCLVIEISNTATKYKYHKASTLRVETLTAVMYEIQSYLVHPDFHGSQRLGYNSDIATIKVCIFKLNITKNRKKFDKKHVCQIY